MGSFTRVLVCGCWAFLAALATGCASHAPLPLPDAAAIGPIFIESLSDSVAMPPFESRQLVFRVGNPQGEAVPGVVLHFSILDDADSGGAQLSFSSALTDTDGTVTLQVIAGKGPAGPKPLRFTVQASAENADPLPIPIFITAGPLASVEIVPIFPDQPLSNSPVITTYIYFYDDTTCASVSLAHPPTSTRPRQPASEALPATFTSVVTGGVHAVLGQALDAQAGVLAEGCADVLGASLSADRPMRVLLPLAWLYPSPVGSFHAVSQVYFRTLLPGTDYAQNAWKILSNRACDPVRLWLDCTIDALSGTSADDPLDCQPVAAGEGPLGALLAARRAVADGPCANQVDGSGRPSLEAQIYAMFPTGSLEHLQLKTLPDEIGNALTRLTVESTLTVTACGIANTFNIDHSLTTIALPNASLSSIAMTALAAPVREAAFVSGRSKNGRLEIDPHSFTLRLGLAARFAFGASSLATRSNVTDFTDVASFIEAMVQLATHNDSGTLLRGCDALDSLLCAEGGQAPGCVLEACLAGLEALSQRLDASFSALDGQDLDFHLSGSAPLVDRDGDGHAEALGSSSSPLGGPGRWSGTYESQTGNTDIYGSWTAEQTPALSQ